MGATWTCGFCGTIVLGSRCPLWDDAHETADIRAQLAAAQRALVAIAEAALAAHKAMIGDAAPESLAAKSALRAGLTDHTPAIRAAREAQP